MEDKNPLLESIVDKQESDLKLWLVNYVGEKTNPTNGDVTVENIIEVMAIVQKRPAGFCNLKLNRLAIIAPAKIMHITIIFARAG